MIGVRMGEDQGVDPPDLPAPEKGGDHLPSHVEAVVRKAPSVDKHLRAPREFKEDGVALAHVEKSDPKVLLEAVPEAPPGPVRRQGEEGDGETDPRRPAPAQVDRQKEEQIEEAQFQHRGRRDIDRGAGQAGRPADQAEQGQGQGVVDLDEEDRDRGKEEGKERGGQGEGDDEKTDPGDDDEIGHEAEGREAVEVIGHQRCRPQAGHEGDQEGMARGSSLRSVSRGAPEAGESPSEG